MKRRRFTVEQIIRMLREAEVHLSQGKSVKLMSRELGITEQTYYRWRKEYGARKSIFPLSLGMIPSVIDQISTDIHRESAKI